MPRLVALLVPLVLVATSPPRAGAGPVHCATPPGRQVAGPCLVADTFAVSFAPVASRWVLLLNFGLAWSTGTGVELVCEEAYGRFVPEDVLADGAGWVYTPGPSGLLRSQLGEGCAWTAVAGFAPGVFVRQVVNHPARPLHQVALAVDGTTRVIYRSQDGGNSFVPGHRFTTGAIYWRLHQAPSNPDVVWVYGSGVAGPFALARSRDGGASFEVRDPLPAFPERDVITDLLEVAPDDADGLYFARTTRDAGEELWKSSDGGVTVRRLLALRPSEQIAGLAFGDDPRTLYLAGKQPLERDGEPPAHLYISRDGGETWQAPIASSESGPRYRCLERHGGQLWACATGPESGDTFLLGSSNDEGRSWQPVLTMANLAPPKGCVAGLCLDTAAWLCERYQICDPGLADAGFQQRDAGAADAASADAASNHEAGDGCGCRLAGANPRAPLGLWLAFAIALVQRRRRPSLPPIPAEGSNKQLSREPPCPSPRPAP